MLKSEAQNLTFAIISGYTQKKFSKRHLTKSYDSPILNYPFEHFNIINMHHTQEDCERRIKCPATSRNIS